MLNRLASHDSRFNKRSQSLAGKLDIKISKKAKIRNQYNQVPHLTQGTIWESDTTTIIHHTQESQEASPFAAGDHKAAMNRQESMTNTKHK